MKEIFHRTSTRKFLDKEVEEDKINLILKAAMQAPSAKNGQPWEFYIIRNKDTLLALSEATPYAMCVKNANQAIVVCYKKELVEKDYVEIDCAIATENILLELDSLGLGGVMIGVSPVEERMEKVEKIINIDDGLRAFTIIPFGYPEREKQQQDRFDIKKIHYIN